MDLWLGLFVPAATPAPAFSRMGSAVANILRKPETVAGLTRLGAQPRGTTAEEAAAVVRAEHDAWREVITRARIML